MSTGIVQDLTQLGFVRDSDTPRWRRNGTTFESDGRWSVLRTACDTELDPLQAPLAGRGLWKPIVTGRGAIEHVFDLPPIAFADDGEEPSASPITACIEWALATADGNLPDGWQSPPCEEVESWIPRGGLTAQFGQIIRQGTLHHEQDRLALRFPVAPRVPEDLPARRRDWLRAVLRDGQSRARMARIGVGAKGAIEAEVDLSGAPRMAVESLFGAGLESLRWLVEWLEIADFLVSDAASASRVWEVCEVRA